MIDKASVKEWLLYIRIICSGFQCSAGLYSCLPHNPLAAADSDMSKQAEVLLKLYKMIIKVPNSWQEMSIFVDNTAAPATDLDNP